MSSSDEEQELRERLEASWPSPNIEHLLEHGMRAYDVHQQQAPTVDRGRTVVAMIAAASALVATPTFLRTFDAHSILSAFLSLETSIAKPFRRIFLHHFVRVLPEYIMEYIMWFPLSILVVFACIGLARALFFSNAVSATRRRSLTTATLVVFLVSMWPTSFVAALTIDGDWPPGRPVTASAESEPLTQALARIGAAARVSIVLHGEDERAVSYHFEGADLRDALTALLPQNAEVHIVGRVVSVTLPPPPTEVPIVAIAPPPTLPTLTPVPASNARGSSRNDVLLFGSDFTLEASESADSVAVVGGDVHIDGHVTHDVIVTGGKLTIRGHVDGDAVVIGGELILEDSAIVDGMTNVTGGHVRGQAHQSNGAPSRTRVQGGSNHHESSRVRRSNSWFGAVLNLGLVLAVGLLLQSVQRARWNIVRERLIQQPWQSLGFGLAAFVLTLVLTLGLVVSCIGIPVAAALFLAFAVALYAAVAISAEAFAKTVGARIPWLFLQHSIAMQLAFGLLLLALGWCIPVLGALLLAVAIFAGLGAIASTRFGKTVVSKEADYLETSAIVRDHPNL